MPREKKTHAAKLAIIRKQKAAAKEWLDELDKREAAEIAAARAEAASLLAQVEE